MDKNLRSVLLNTEARSNAYLQADRKLSGNFFQATDPNKWKEGCDFDPDALNATTWKTYQDQKHGYEFKYSPEWLLKDWNNLEENSMGGVFLSRRLSNGENNYVSFIPQSTALYNPSPGKPKTDYEEIGSKFAFSETWQLSYGLFKRYYILDPIPGWTQCNQKLTNKLSCGKIEYFATNDAMAVEIYRFINSIKFTK
jgi:hypothetical protein